MTNLLDQPSTWLVDHSLTGLLFVVLVFLTFAEAGLFFGFVLPGETALLLGGALTATGALPFWPFLARGQALVPFLAGQARMRCGVFFRWNLAAAVVWAGGVVVLGHLFARSVSVPERVYGWFGLAVLVALVAALVVRHRRRAHLAPDAAGPGG